jgi:hypothetical protein
MRFEASDGRRGGAELRGQCGDFGAVRGAFGRQAVLERIHAVAGPDRAAQAREKRAYLVRFSRSRRRREQPLDWRRLRTADAEHAEPVPVQELERRMRRPQLFPQPPGAEVPLADVRVVEEDDAAIAELREPARIVRGDRLVGVAPVDVQQIDCAVGEVREGFVEGRPNQPRERRELARVIALPFLEHAFIVEAGLIVAAPGIDGVGGGRQRQQLNRLRERRVAVARLRAELDEGARPRRLDDPEGERDVLEPRRRMDDPIRFAEDDRPVEEAGQLARHLRERSGITSLTVHAGLFQDD